MVTKKTTNLILKQKILAKSYRCSLTFGEVYIKLPCVKNGRVVIIFPDS